MNIYGEQNIWLLYEYYIFGKLACSRRLLGFVSDYNWECGLIGFIDIEKLGIDFVVYVAFSKVMVGVAFS